MTRKNTCTRLYFLALICIFTLSACDKVLQRKTADDSPTKITTADECHVCGMIVANFPGPKGQALIQHRDKTLKFCSTVDLVTWMLQPDTKAVLRIAYVHDMAAAGNWDKPSDSHYVNAKSAWYVAGHSKPGAMGHTLASFKEKLAAKMFIQKYGGRLLRLSEINHTTLADLQNGATTDQL